ncbi:hypothetical protein CCP3SC1AL1_1860004 [Gammaproteobacteria bacterium]
MLVYQLRHGAEVPDEQRLGLAKLKKFLALVDQNDGPLRQATDEPNQVVVGVRVGQDYLRRGVQQLCQLDGCLYRTLTEIDDRVLNLGRFVDKEEIYCVIAANWVEVCAVEGRYADRQPVRAVRTFFPVRRDAEASRQVVCELRCGGDRNASARQGEQAGSVLGLACSFGCPVDEDALGGRIHFLDGCLCTLALATHKFCRQARPFEDHRPKNFMVGAPVAHHLA